MSAQNKSPSSKSSEPAEMKPPSSSKSFEPTSTGKSTNESDLLTQVTPGKRALDFSSPVKSPQYSPHGGKQVSMYGYMLKVGNIMKSRSDKEWYEI